MYLMKRIVILVIFVLTGCATSASAPSFSQAPAPQPKSDTAVLYIFRENAVPYAFSGYVDIDDVPAVQLAQQGFSWVYVKPGQHKFKHYWPLLAGMPKVEFSKELEAGKTYVFEMKGKVAVRTISTEIHLVPFDEARSTMSRCCRFTPSIDGRLEF